MTKDGESGSSYINNVMLLGNGMALGISTATLGIAGDIVTDGRFPRLNRFANRCVVGGFAFAAFSCVYMTMITIKEVTKERK